MFIGTIFRSDKRPFLPSLSVSLSLPLTHTHTHPFPTPFIIPATAEKQFVLGVTDLMQSALLHAFE